MIYPVSFLCGGFKIDQSPPEIGVTAHPPPDSLTQPQPYPVLTSFPPLAPSLLFPVDEVESMSSEQRDLSSPMNEEEDEFEPVPRPRRRFRGLHWRHVSQSYTPPPPSSLSPQQTPPRLQSLSLNFDGLEGLGSSPSGSMRRNTTSSSDSPPSYS